MNQPAENQTQSGAVSLAQSSPTVGTFRERDGALEWSGRQETVRIEPWGPDAVRVRARLGGAVLEGLPGALLDEPQVTESTVKIQDGEGRLTVGALTVEVDAEGQVRFLRTADGTELLAEERAHFWWPGPRLYTPTGNGHHRLEQRFAAYEGEKLYGLGQHQHGLLDQKGAVLDLVQRNAEVTVPVLTSSRGYTFLWNSPAIGRVELAGNGTRWVADSARQLDYWITAGTPADAQRRYSAATGRTPMLPEWAAGFWQCKLRYRTQDELLDVAREYKRRGLSCPPSSATSSTGPTWATGSSTRPSGRTRRRCSANSPNSASSWSCPCGRRSPRCPRTTRSWSSAATSSAPSTARWPTPTGPTRRSPPPSRWRSTTRRTPRPVTSCGHV